MQKIVISGYYGFNNSGDEAILTSLISSIKKIGEKNGEKIKVTVLSSNPEFTEKRHAHKLNKDGEILFRSVHRFNPIALIREISSCNILISGGGSLLQDKTSIRSIIYYVMVKKLALFFGKKVFVYANGVGPLNKDFSRKIVKSVFNKLDCATLRDEKSYKLMKQIGVTNKNMTVSADPVFSLNALDANKTLEIIKKIGLTEDEEYITISVRNWENRESFVEFFSFLLNHIGEKYSKKIVFLNMHFPRDIKTSEMIAKKLRMSYTIIKEDLSPEEIMAVISRGRYCISMRLHGLIFAARMKVPALAFSYDPKIEAFCQEFDIPKTGSTQDFDLDDAIKTLADFEENLNEYKERITKKSKVMEEKSRINDIILEDLILEKNIDVNSILK